MRARLRGLLLRAAAAALAHAPHAVRRAEPPRLLLVRPDHLGDLLFVTPALHALRQAQPTAEITALVGPWAAPLLVGNPDVDRVETLNFPWFDRQPRRSLLNPYARLLAALPALRGRYDVAVVLRFDHWWGGLLVAAAGIPRRIGYATPELAPFLTEPVPYRLGQHEVVQNLGLTARLGTAAATATPEAAPLRLSVPPDAAAAARRWVPSGSGPLVALHPGSGAPVKAWPTARWVAVVAHLHARWGARIVLTGGPGAETALAHEVAAQAGVAATVAAGETTLPTLAALLQRCDLVIGLDTGPLHLAVAVGTPTLHLYGPIDPRLFGPWGPAGRHRVVAQSLACQFCHRLDWPAATLPDHPCVMGIPVAWVTTAADEMLR